MKKGISKFSRALLIVLSTIFIVATFTLAYYLYEDSMMVVDYGNHKDKFFIPFYERDNSTYEDSELFGSIFESSVEEIIRMSVIKNQMETDGVYDPDKAINICTYANRNKTIQNEVIEGVEYRLDDLINWGNKGIKYENVSADEIPFVISEGALNVVVGRYKTIDGKDLLEYATSQDEYDMLVNNLIDTTQALFSNYKEYIAFGEKYGVGKSNVLYCIQMYNDGKPVRFTNMEVISTKHTADEITGLFKNQLKYVYFNPDKMTLATNTKISAFRMQEVVNGYSYSFNDNSRIWIGFDNMYSASDGFTKGKLYYESKSANTNGVEIIVAIWVSFFAYLSILVYLIVKEGRPYIKKGKEPLDDDSWMDEIQLKKVDFMPIEFLAVLAFGVLILDLIVGGYSASIAVLNIFEGVLPYLAVIIGTIIINVTFMPTVLCLTRKVKAGNWKENSCIIWVIESVRKSTINAYDNGHAIIRTWIPYIIFLLLNLILVILAPVGLIVAFVIDMFVGTFLYKNYKERKEIVDSINIISQSDVKHQMDTTKMHGDNLELANAVNNIGNGIRKAVEKSMKDEKMKADLITNVSHDIKTPLTSIINYVDLLKRENIQDEKISGYIDVLDQKSQRLKQLTDDLVEASKISSGNIVLNFERINIVELVNQSIGEYEDKFAEHGLKCRFDPPEKPVYISADSKSMFRIIENLYNNIYKYALHGTRVYIDLEECGVEGATRVQLSVKNISESQLNMSADELLERFKQGDESRTTEGSGLGLSITKSLTEAMNGQFDLLLDGDLFKVILTFNTLQ